MAAITLNKEHATTVRVGDRLFDLWESDDGGLYIEAPDCDGLTVAISDDGESEVTASGMWLTVRPWEKPEEK